MLRNDYSKNNDKSTKPALIIFARYPRKGKVKTRLAEDTGEDFAYNFYKLCSENILNEVEKLSGFDKYLFYADEADRNKIIDWIGNDFFYVPQSTNDLGHRMLSAFETVFNRGAGSAIIIGTDVPDLNNSTIKKAEMQLQENDLVIGPACDGGYYLLGMKKPYKELFYNIEWGMGSVFQSTINNAKELNLKTHLVDKLYDIDTINDLRLWLSGTNNKALKEKVRELNKQLYTNITE